VGVKMTKPEVDLVLVKDELPNAKDGGGIVI
jgi:hypothetical protein